MDSKNSQIIRDAVKCIPESVRMNHVFGNLFLYDAIRTHITELKTCMKKHAILRLDNKRQTGILENSIGKAFADFRKRLGEDAYSSTPDFLDKMEEEFNGSLKVLYYTAKRELDRTGQPMSDLLAHLVMVYLLSGLEIIRTIEYARKIMEASKVPMEATREQNIVTIKNVAGKLLARLSREGEMIPREISMAFNIFKNELGNCTIAFNKKEAS